MARTLQEATQHMKGVGRKESIALASYLQRAVLRTEHLLEDIIQSGAIENMKRGSSKEGQDMLDRILELAKEAKGKSAAETTEINGRISAIVKTLEKSGKDGAKLVEGLKKSGVVDAVSKRATIGELFKDEIKGKVEGFKDTMIRKIPMVGGILANVRKAHIAGKQAEADEMAKGQSADEEEKQEKQRADVAHKDASDSKKALEKVADATSSTAESTGGIEAATTEEEYDAGEEEREGKKKSKLGKMFGGLSGLVSGRRKEGGGAGGLIGDLFGPALGGAFMAALGPVLGGLGSALGVVGSVLSSPLVLAAGAAMVGFWAGGKLFEEWLGPMMDASFKKDMDARASVHAQEKKDVFVQGEGGEKLAVYNVGDKMLSETAAIEALGGKGKLEEALADENSGVTRATVTVSAHTGRAKGGGQEMFGSLEELEQFSGQKSASDAIARGGSGVNAQFLENMRRDFRNDEQHYLDIMTRKFELDDYASAEAQEEAFETRAYDTRVNVNKYRGSAKRLGLMKEFNATIQAFPFVSKAMGGMLDNLRADVEEIGGKYRVTGNLGNVFGGDITSEQYLKEYGEPSKQGPSLHEGGVISGTRDITATLRPNEAVIPLDDPNILQMIQMVTTNAMSKGSNILDGAVAGSAIFAPSTSNNIVNNNDTVYAYSPTTRNPEKTYNRVTYQ